MNTCLIRIDRLPIIHVAVMRGGVTTMRTVCGLRALTHFRYAMDGDVKDLCQECQRILDEQSEKPPTR